MKKLEDDIKATKRKLAELKKEKKKEEQRRLMEEEIFEKEPPEEKAEKLWSKAYAIARSSTRCGRGLDVYDSDAAFEEAGRCRFKLWEEYKSTAREAVRYEQMAKEEE
jgi:hypothetical protein